jgi:hypothetical protein
MKAQSFDAIALGLKFHQHGQTDKKQVREFSLLPKAKASPKINRPEVLVKHSTPSCFCFCFCLFLFVSLFGGGGCLYCEFAPMLLKHDADYLSMAPHQKLVKALYQSFLRQVKQVSALKAGVTLHLPISSARYYATLFHPMR